MRYKAAALFRNIVKGHCLVDGNKRLGVTSVTVFLRLNGYETTYSNREVYRYALRVARQAGNYPVEHIHGWISRHTQLLPHDALEEARSFNQRLYDRTSGEYLSIVFARSDG